MTNPTPSADMGHTPERRQMTATYRHLLPTGVIAKRDTKSSYSFVVVVTDSDGTGVWRWSATHAGAQSYAASLQRKGFDATVEKINHGVRS